MDCSLLGSSVHGIFQARILEWVAISFSRGSSLTWRSNPGLPYCRRTLYYLSHQGLPIKSLLTHMDGLLACFFGWKGTEGTRKGHGGYRDDILWVVIKLLCISIVLSPVEMNPTQNLPRNCFRMPGMGKKTHQQCLWGLTSHYAICSTLQDSQYCTSTRRLVPMGASC